MGEPTPIRPDTAAAPWPEPLDRAAFHGLAGAIVEAILPHTEADPAGLLVTLLAAVGNVIGAGPHYAVSGARHPGRVFPVLVGATGSGRKGMALTTLAPLFEATFPAWWARQEKGLSSGEGLIWRVRDPIETWQPAKGRAIVTDPGIEDKRLFVPETEFGQILKVLTRENNTLSTVIRDAWDGGMLSTLTKHNAARATNPHITIVGHVTPEELLELLSDREASNGFANRFLWICVTRSKVLPHGGELDEDALLSFGRVLEETANEARGLGRLRFDDAARAAWERVYEPLTAGEPGLVGRLLSRGAPTVLRLAVIYAALDVAGRIGVAHLAAALAVWGYADASVRHVFGALVADQEDPLGPTILAALDGGDLTQTEISELFGRNMPAARLHGSLERLRSEGSIALAFDRPSGGRGRSIMRWSRVR